MSQVVVEEDQFRNRREATRRQELEIDREATHRKWLKTGTQGLDLIKKIAGIAFLPVVIFWSFLAGIMGLCISVVGFLFRILGRFPKDK